jgi:hypothetical protein
MDPATSRLRPTEDRTERVERLVYEGMARRWAEAEVYGGEVVLEDGG